MLGFECRHSALPPSHSRYHPVGLDIVTRDTESGKELEALCSLAGGFLSVDPLGAGVSREGFQAEVWNRAAAMH